MWPRLMSETFESLKEKNSKNITILAYKTVHIIEKDNIVKRSKHAYSDDQIHKQIAAVELKIYFENYKMKLKMQKILILFQKEICDSNA